MDQGTDACLLGRRWDVQDARAEDVHEVAVATCKTENTRESLVGDRSSCRQGPVDR